MPAPLTRTRTILPGDSSTLSSCSDDADAHSIRSIRTLSDHGGWAADDPLHGAPLTRMGPSLMRLPRVLYLRASSTPGSGKSARSSGAASYAMSPLSGPVSRGGSDFGEGEEFLVHLETSEGLDPHSPEFATKLLSVMEGVNGSAEGQDRRSSLGCFSCTGSDVEAEGEGEGETEPESPIFLGHMPDADSVDELLSHASLPWEDASGKPTWVHFQPSHLDDPPLLVKRLPASSTEVSLLYLLVSPRWRHNADNPIPEQLGIVEHGEWVIIMVEERKTVQELYLRGSGFARRCIEAEKKGFMQQMLRYLAFLHSLHITCTDLSPDNILVTEHQYGNIYSILDYASCFRFAPSGSQHNLQVHIPTFDWPEASKGAPEMDGGEGEDVNPFDVDIWALGRTLSAVDYKGTGLEPIVEAMHAEDPGGRPAAVKSLEMFYEVTGDG